MKDYKRLKNRYYDDPLNQIKMIIDKKSPQEILAECLGDKYIEYRKSGLKHHTVTIF
jgi:hypothetical protein